MPAPRDEPTDRRAAAERRPAPWQVAVGGLCPRCGARGLFAGIIRFAPACPRCGLDFEAFDIGDGPAAILTLVVGSLVAGLVIALELAVSPPWWVHALLWPPLALVLVMGSLRLAKAALAALEFRHAAHEARLRRP